VLVGVSNLIVEGVLWWVVIELMTKKILTLLLGLLAIVLFFFFGRVVWYPIYLKVKGEKTTSDVVSRIKESQRFDHDFSDWKSLDLFCFKEERVIEVWAKGGFGRKKIKEFVFQGFSGELGPKLREGDGQIPEGVYGIEYLNPNSRFHLSMKLSYPNAFDRKMGERDGRKKLGYDIFIHGKSATVGCIPIGDEGIEELFLMVAEVGKSNVRVVVAPYDLRLGRRKIDIAEIEWEEELYDLIESALQDGL